MLRYEFVEKINGEFLYAYYPEGNRNAPGIVSLKKKGEGKVIEESSEDFGKRYAYHAICGIDLNSTNGTVAWY